MRISQLNEGEMFGVGGNVYTVVPKGKHSGGKMECVNVKTKETCMFPADKEVTIVPPSVTKRKFVEFPTYNKKVEE